ncbi:MAG: reverse transcriptase [Pseudomonadota bacterium]
MAFQLSDKHFKTYPHFDQIISSDELHAIVDSPERVASNAFFPFIQYAKSYQPFRDGKVKVEKKERLIRYASRRDSAIFARYRADLSTRYEARLSALGIADVPIAYRKIPDTSGSGGGKCNIDFAHDLFRAIQTHDACVVIALDIRKYFESIDHRRLYTVWCSLLETDSLPRDHLALFKAITSYRYVDRTAAYERLGFIAPVRQKDGSVRADYTVPFKQMPKQLCSPKDFREKIAGKGGAYSSLIQRNNNPYGIPQGAPLSDLLANAYLMDFDVELARYARERGGQYWRYSDDLALVLPGDGSVGKEAEKWVTNRIHDYGDAMQIKAAKTSIGTFTRTGSGVHHYQYVAGDGGRDGIQYLGFRFDGRQAYLRNSTLSNLYRKITKRARRQARNHFARYQGHNKESLMQKFDFHGFEQRFGRVRDFENVADSKGWTFWTYARRASERFGDLGQPILAQVSGYRGYVRRSVSEELDRLFSYRAAHKNPFITRSPEKGCDSN